MPILTLPPTFHNSFWSQDYRRGLETIHAKLAQGVEENDEIINFIRTRASVERTLAESLINPPLTGPQGAGLGRDDGASLLVAFRGLQAESVKQGEVHKTIAHDLDTLVVDPFENWADSHAERVAESKKLLIDGWLKNYETGLRDVAKLKTAYLTKTRKADDAEDDLKFAPNTDVRETYTSPRAPPKRSDSVSDRIKLQLGIKPSAGEDDFDTQSLFSDTHSTDAELEKPTLTAAEKGKAKESIAPISTGDPSQSYTVLLAGLAFPGLALPNLLARARIELPMKTVKFPIIGEYEETFTGEDFVTWLKDRVPGFGGSLNRAETAAKELTERDNLLRRLGELGNKFENTAGAIYQFRPKAFEAPEPPASPQSAVFSPTVGSPVATTFLKRSNTVASYIAKTLGTNANSEPPYVKARLEAEHADEKYRAAVRALDRQRMALEDRIEANLKLWNRWELDRLNAVKTVLLQYQGTLANFPTSFAPTLENSSAFISSFQPESDLQVLIERYRTGPFRPAPQIYKAIGTERTDVVFGIDLRHWAGQAGWNDIRNGTTVAEKDTPIPYVLSGLLGALNAAYEKQSNLMERRKAWIYEVPLPSQHQLREALNNVPEDSPVPAEILAKYDAPVLAGTLKLWLLELDPPIALWEGWDEIRKLYPTVGADTAEESNIVDDLKLALGRLPKVHLLALDAVVSHLKNLIESTAEVEEPREVYVNKLALTVGRSILRPKVETGITIQDRHPTLFFIDLLNQYEEILPPTIAKKKRDSDRPMPTRKRTRPVDQRVNRSSLSGKIDVQHLLELQMEKQTGRTVPPSLPPVPQLPQLTEVDSLPATPVPPPEKVQTPKEETPVEPPAEAEKPLAAEPLLPPPVAPPAAHNDSDLPPRPVFAEPEPEEDELAAPSQPSAPVVVIPPTPVKARPPPIARRSSSPRASSTSPSSGKKFDPSSPLSPRVTSATRSSPTSSGSRPGSPAKSQTPTPPNNEDEPIVPRTGGSSISRHSSNNSVSRSGARIVKGPRTVGSPTIHGRTESASVSREPISRVRGEEKPANPADYAPRRRVGHVSSASFQRGHLATRSMQSGSEDDVLGKNAD